MVKDAEAHAGEDAKRREAVDTKNRAEAMAYETEKFLKENGEKIPSDKKMKVENGIQALKDALKVGDASKVAPVDKFSLVLVAIFAFTFLGERPSLREWSGIIMVAGGVLLLALKR